MFKRIIFLLGGLFLYGLGIVMTVKSSLGTGPWDAFHLGITNYVPLTMGQICQLTGVVIVLLSLALGVKPGVGTIANMYFIGLFIDLIMQNNLINTPQHWFSQLILLLAGVLVIGWATFFYITAAWGAGPRDGLMLGLINKTGWPVWKIRTIIEVTITLLAYFLGGPIGVGTLIVALTLGPSIQLAFFLMGKKAEDITHEDLETNIGQVKNWLKEVS